MKNLATIWIVDRDPRRRSALTRLAGNEHQAVLGAPEDSLFNSAELPRVVVVGLSNDFEAELDFIHRLGPRVGDCGWILISNAGDSDELARLFDTLDARILPWPPPASELRRAIRSLRRVRSAAPLSQRTGRESLAARFSRWFSGDELNGLLRTLDPSLAWVPILVRGEAGTGRRLLGRYIHAFGSEPGAGFVPVFCEGVETPDQLLSQLDVASLRAEGQPLPGAITIWLDEVDRLALATQKRLHSWIDFGLPRGAGLSHLRIRWTASAGEEASEHPGRQLEAGLAEALSELVLRLPPLRTQPAAIERFAQDTAAAWCEERKSRTREFDPEALQTLAQHPWPGNLRELELVVMRTLAGSASPTITAAELCFDSGGFDSSGEAAVPRPVAAKPSALASPIADAVLEPDQAPTAANSPQVGPLQDGSGMGVPRTEDEVTVEAELEPHEIDRMKSSGRGLAASLEDVEAVRPVTTPALPSSSWANILRAVAHEVRNPLVSIRTFSELLPEHHADSDFRARFSELVGADVRRIEEVVARLQELSELSHAKRQPVDIVSLLDELLEERRDVIEARKLLVLKELDQSHPNVWGDGQLLRSALGGIFNRALEWVPERGDLYIASQHRSQGSADNGSIRVLLRFQGASATRHSATGDEASSLAESTLEFVAAQAVILALGGTFTLDTTERLTIIVLDLPAPPI